MIIQRCISGQNFVSRIGDHYFGRPHPQVALANLTIDQYMKAVAQMKAPVETFDEPLTDLRDTQFRQDR